MLLSWKPVVVAGVSGLIFAGAGLSQKAAARSASSDAPPLCFEPNLGQLDAEARFSSRGPGYALWLTERGAQLALRAGSSPDDNVLLGLSIPAGGTSTPAPSGRQEGHSSYFHGSDPAKWVTGVPRFARVTYPSVRPGVDLVFRGDQGRLEYDFVVAPGASATDATLEVTGAQGLAVDERGDLLIVTRAGVLRQPPPVIFQTDERGERLEVAGSYRIVDEARIAFAVPAYDETRALVIDPVLIYSTYLGGSSVDQANAVATDASGNVLVAGFTSSVDFPTTHGAAQGSSGGSLDAFVAKLDPTGKTLLYATYFGGSGEDVARAVAVDDAGSAYVAGNTESATGFPSTMNAFQGYPAGPGNAFAIKLSPNGDSLVYATCLGGTGFDVANAIAIDGAGDAYVAGYTQSADFPTANPLQPAGAALAGAQNAFLAELSPDGQALLAGTYLGGMANDSATGIAVDSQGNVAVTGYTQSADFPTVHSIYPFGGMQNAFVALLSPHLKSLTASTFLGGSGEDAANAIALDATENVYVAGSTSSPDFPTKNPLQSMNRGSENAFVAELTPSLSALTYATYLGGSSTDAALALSVASSGEAYVVGQTQSSDFPLRGAFQVENRASTSVAEGNAFVALLASGGQDLVGSSYLGGAGGASARAIALTSSATAWIAGNAGVGLPILNGLYSKFTAEGPAGQNAFLANVGPASGTLLDAGPDSGVADAGEPDVGSVSGDSGGIGVVGPLTVQAAGGSGAGSGCTLERRGSSSRVGGQGGALAGIFVLGALARRRRRPSPLDRY